MATIWTPWKMIGSYEDYSEITVEGNNESECMADLIELQDRHGKLLWYSGVCDEHYDCGQCIYD